MSRTVVSDAVPRAEPIVHVDTHTVSHFGSLVMRMRMRMRMSRRDRVRIRRPQEFTLASYGPFSSALLLCPRQAGHSRQRTSQRMRRQGE